MTDNPLAVRRQSGAVDAYKPPLILDDLERYAEELNRKAFTIALGWHWLVASRKKENGDVERYLDRRENWRPEYQTWKPDAMDLERVKLKAADDLRADQGY